MPEGTDKMTCQALEAHQKVGQLHKPSGGMVEWNDGMTSATLAPVTCWYQLVLAAWSYHSSCKIKSSLVYK